MLRRWLTLPLEGKVATLGPMGLGKAGEGAPCGSLMAPTSVPPLKGGERATVLEGIWA